MSRTTGNYTIRLALRRDARAIAAMSRELIETGLGWSWTVPRVLRSVADAQTNVIVAARAERVVGFAIMQYDEERAHLLLFAVAADCRQRGLGTALWRWLEATARVAGMRTVHLEVRATNERARRFYQRLGFTEDETVKGYYNGVEAALRMHLELVACRT